MALYSLTELLCGEESTHSTAIEPLTSNTVPEASRACDGAPGWRQTVPEAAAWHGTARRRVTDKARVTAAGADAAAQ